MKAVPGRENRSGSRETPPSVEKPKRGSMFLPHRTEGERGAGAPRLFPSFVGCKSGLVGAGAACCGRLRRFSWREARKGGRRSSGACRAWTAEEAEQRARRRKGMSAGVRPDAACMRKRKRRRSRGGKRKNAPERLPRRVFIGRLRKVSLSAPCGSLRPNAR